MKNAVKIVLYCVMGVYAVLGAARLTGDVFALPETPMQIINNAVNSSKTETQAETEEGFVVKTAGGKIVVEDVSTGKIVRATDTRVSSLPEKDRNQLKKGIKVKTNSELRGVLEDFCS